MNWFENLSLKNKIFFSTLAFILLLSVVIALFTRWVLISSLTTELEHRGLGIARNIADNSREFILTENSAELTNLTFEARRSGRNTLVRYAFIMDKNGKLLSHTFTEDFPDNLLIYGRSSDTPKEKMKLLMVGGQKVYNIAVPVKEGLYEIGWVHVGLLKSHIDNLIGKLRITFLGFLSSVTFFFFIICHNLSNYITRPISELIKVSDEISRGNYDIEPSFPAGLGVGAACMEEFSHLADEPEVCLKTHAKTGEGAKPPAACEHCPRCDVHRENIKDEVRQLSNSFFKMTNRIKISRMKLRQSEEKYRYLFSSGPNPIFVCDFESLEILAANPRAEETFGYTLDELKGIPMTTLGPFDHAAMTEDAGGNGGSRLNRSKVQYYRKNGSAVHVNVHACPAKFQDRIAVIIATADISELVEKDSQLIQASKMTNLGKMSAGIAHELNQPLNAIKMGSEYLKLMMDRHMEIPDRDLYHVVNEVSSQVDRASDIIKRLRDFGRKADFSREKVNINTPLLSVARIVERQLGMQNIKLGLDLGENIPYILAHNNRLEQVLFNLVTNSRDAITERSDEDPSFTDKVIGIRSFSENGRVLVTVSDTGNGIPDSVRDRIFEAFFTTKEMGEGMGMGLSIIYGIVKDYDGNIDVDSTVNKGTTFTLTFPAREARTDAPDI